MQKRAIATGVGIIAGLLVVAGGLALWKYRSIKSSQHGGGFEPSETVDAVDVRTVSFAPTSELVGTALAVQSVSLSNEVAGVVKQVQFESGQIVDAGQVLVVLDASTEQADLASAEASIMVSEAGVRSAEANVRSVESALVLAESNVRRWEPAVQAKAASATDLDRARADVDRARADLDAAKAVVERAKAEVVQNRARAEQIKTMIAKKTLRAPFKARAGLRNVHPGQYLAENTTMVGLQAVTPDIYVDFAVPQEYAQRVKIGDSVMATSSVFGPEPVRIGVVAMDATANPTTRNVRIRSVVANPDEKLRPGMFVDVKVAVAALREYLAVPSTAVRRSSFGDHVFVLTPGDKPEKFVAKQRFVKVGPTIGSDVIILEGVNAGERIAAAGSYKLRENAPVTIAQPKGPSGGKPLTQQQGPPESPEHARK